MSRRRLVWGTALAALVVVAVGIGLGRRPMAAMAESAPAVPTARVTRGMLEVTVHLDGDLRASRQAAITAPTVGGALRILHLLDTGTTVSKGDVVLEFDPADQQYALEQAESQLREAEQQIIKGQADADVQAAQDQVTLLTAQFDVRRAELDAAVDEDLIPANDYQIRQVSLEEARKTLARTDQDVHSRQTTGRANLAVLREQRAKAQIAAERARQNIDDLVVRAPIDGVVSVRENRDASGGVFYSGMTLPPYRVGDVANPGRPVVDVFDVSRMEIRARVNEQDRGNLSVGQAVTVASDEVPGVPLRAHITAVSSLGRAVQLAGPLRLFDVTLELDRPDARLRPGTSVRVLATGPRIEDALILPRQAVFERDGKSVVFVRAGDGFEPHEIRVLHRTEARVGIDGVDEGTDVALIQPGEASGGATAAGRASGPGARP